MGTGDDLGGGKREARDGVSAGEVCNLAWPQVERRANGAPCVPPATTIARSATHCLSGQRAQEIDWLAVRGSGVAGETRGAPLRAIPPPLPVLPREIGNLAYVGVACIGTAYGGCTDSRRWKRFSAVPGRISVAVICV